MYDNVDYPHDHSSSFIDYNHSVFHHLQQVGVEVAEWGAFAIAASLLQDDLRAPRSALRALSRLPEFMPIIDPDLYRGPVERTFGVDLDGVPQQAIRLIVYVALTSLVPGQLVDGSPADPRTLNTMHMVALGLRALQLPGRRDDVIEFSRRRSTG